MRELEPGRPVDKWVEVRPAHQEKSASDKYFTSVGGAIASGAGECGCGCGGWARHVRVCGGGIAWWWCVRVCFVGGDWTRKFRSVGRPQGMGEMSNARFHKVPALPAHRRSISSPCTLPPSPKPNHTLPHPTLPHTPNPPNPAQGNPASWVVGAGQKAMGVLTRPWDHRPFRLLRDDKRKSACQLHLQASGWAAAAGRAGRWVGGYAPRPPVGSGCRCNRQKGEGPG